MAKYTLISDDTQDGGAFVAITQDDLEYLGDVAELMLQFLRAAGYTYVNQLVIVKDSGDKLETVL